MFDDLLSHPLQAVWLTAALTLVGVVAVAALRAARRPDPTRLQTTAAACARRDRAADEHATWLGADRA